VIHIPSVRSLLNRRFFIGLILSAAALVLALRGVHLQAVAASLAQANLLLVAAAAACALLATVFSTLRWRVLLWPHTARLAPLTAIFFVSQLVNAALPGKLGAPVRAALTSQEASIPPTFALGSVAVERVLDSALIAALSAVLLLLLPVPQAVRELGGGAALLSLLVLAIVFIAAVLKPRFAPAVAGLLHRFHLPPQIIGLLDALDVLRQRGSYAPLLLYSAVIWLLGTLTNDLVLRSLGMAVPWWTSALLLVALQLGGKLPSSPGNIGVFHYVAVLVLKELGVDASRAFAYAVVLHTVVFIVPAVVGAVCLWWLSTDMRSGTAAQQLATVAPAPDTASQPGTDRYL
jgi:glycosyltransferase 2 family protein